MNDVSKVSGWRSLAGVLGVGVLALGLSLKLEGAPSFPRPGQSAEKAAAPVAQTTTTGSEVVFARPLPTAGSAEKPNRVTAGKIPSTGLKVIATVEVDWEDDEGTRLRRAGLLVGPMPSAGQDSVVAGCNIVSCTGGCPGGADGVACSFAVHCDDNNKCTADRCDFIDGSDACTGNCVHDPIGANEQGECDNGVFCDGKESCQGAKCTVITAPNVLNQVCDTHASCGENGTCDTGTHECTAGNIGEACNKNEDCDVAGRCNGGANNGDVCDSNADCPGGTCTVKGFCSPGICTNGIPAICCDDGPSLTECAEYLAKCNSDSDNAGKACETSSDCKNGLCERCQPTCLPAGTNPGQCSAPGAPAGSCCSDGFRCNGLETCGADGLCRPGVNPCGAGAHCAEKRCGPDINLGFLECLYDSDCPQDIEGFEQCIDIVEPGGIRCFEGRCCRPNVENNDTSWECPGSGACCIGKLAACAAITGSQWYMDDNGENLTSDPCGGYNTADVQRSDPWECPKYSSGFTQHDAASPPIFPVRVGPFSDTPQVSPLPGGPGTRLYQIGDDYKVWNDDYMGLDVFRVVLNVLSNSRYSMDIYDKFGNFVEDVNIGFNFDLAPGLGIIVAIFRAPLTIPSEGFVVLRTSERFEANSDGEWLSTTATGLTGTNDADCLWINTYPGQPGAGCSNNYLKMCAGGTRANQACAGRCVGGADAGETCNVNATCLSNNCGNLNGDCPGSTCGAAPAILAFELAGDKVPDPAGACCQPNGTCTDGVIAWVCTSQGSAYHGDGTLCQSCNGGTNAGNTCTIPANCPPSKVCVGGSNPGAPCNTAPTQCLGGGVCTNQGTCSTGLVGQSCFTNANCNLAGTCNLETLTCNLGACAGGSNQGNSCADNTACPASTCIKSACTTNANCDVAGTCTPVTCEAIAGCGRGACCESDPAICNPTNSAACCTITTGAGAEAACETSGTKTFKGYGTDCDTDDGYEEAQQHTCRIPNNPALRCLGGPFNLNTCATDSDCRRCVGGSQNGQTCTFTSDPASGGANGCLDEGVCTANLCVGGIPGVCTANVCVGGPNEGDACANTNQCRACTDDDECPDNSGHCRGECVVRGTGGDNCNETYVHVISVPTLEEGPKTITLSGTNINASTSEDEPDLCPAGADPTWWDGTFSIDKCARVRLDFCGSPVTREPNYGGIIATCNPDGTCADGIGDSPDPYTTGQDASARGGPYCVGGDDVWETYGPLDPGTYWKRVYAALGGAMGEYQMHITVQACPEAACCYQVCGSICIGGSNAGDICNDNADCASNVCSGDGGADFNTHCDKGNTCAGGICRVGSNNAGAVCTEHFDCGPLSDPDSICSVTCLSQCDEMVKNDCDELLGYFLAPPNTTAVPLCVGDPCEEGSCCTGPGLCIDEDPLVNNAPINKAYCDELNGNFVGKVRCQGGTCANGTNPGDSCNDVPTGQCTGVGGTCVGSAFQKAQTNPCPVCTIEGGGNCQRFENSPDITPSDRGTGSGQLQADDFTPTHVGTQNLTTVCAWGLYDETDLTITGTDCGGDALPESQRADSFRVRIFEDDPANPGKPAGGNCSTATATRCFTNAGCPAGETCLLKPLGESDCTRTKAVVPGAATQTNVIASRMWVYSLTLVNPIPLVGGKCYWLELSNDTGPAYGNKCTWHWNNLLKSSTQGNYYSASGSLINGYDGGSPRNWDQAFCTNLSFAPGGCASVPGGCCTCQTNCTSALLDACDDAGSTWHQGACGTPACAPPPNDRCQDAPDVTVGLYTVSTQCATTDGFEAGHEANTQIENDVWYYYTPAQNCRLRADSCSSGTISFFDSAIAIYTNPNDPSHCPCPASQSQATALEVAADDDACVILGSATGGVAEVDALEGRCYTIRVGGFPGADQGGRTGVDISCGAAVCGDGRRNGDEICDGSDNSNCLLASPSRLCSPDLTGPNACKCGPLNPCGDGDLDAGEQCDTGTPGFPCASPSTCFAAGTPLQCTCSAACGNGVVDQGEDCDETDDDQCPGRCRTSENPQICECPPLACGNGRLEESAGEECEFGKCTTLTGERHCSLAPYALCTTNAPCLPGECLPPDQCGVDAQCSAGQGTCNELAERGDCPDGDCRTANDPLGGCRCGCGAVPPPNVPVWDPATNPSLWPNSNTLATTRSLRFTVAGPAGPSKPEAIKVTMVDLQHPRPANLLAQPPPNFTTYDTRQNAVCVGGALPGHHCDSVADCPGAGATCPNPVACTADPTCTDPNDCTPTSNGCARWVGKPGTFLEFQDFGVAGGTYRASRLQCTPYYHDWKPEGLITVVGAEILPSSEYSVQTYGASCMGAEAGCPAASTGVTMYTRRSGDTGPTFNPPATSTQPDALDVAAVVNKAKQSLSALVQKSITQLQPNLLELNADVSALDISNVVDAVRQVRYAFSGPCPCPSTVTCGATACPAGAGACVTAYGAGAMCVKTCAAGANAGEPCIDSARHCPGSTCGTPLCRDRCGRCTPP